MPHVMQVVDNWVFFPFLLPGQCGQRSPAPPSLPAPRGWETHHPASPSLLSDRRPCQSLLPDRLVLQHGSIFPGCSFRDPAQGTACRWCLPCPGCPTPRPPQTSHFPGRAPPTSQAPASGPCAPINCGLPSAAGQDLRSGSPRSATTSVQTARVLLFQCLTSCL